MKNASECSVGAIRRSLIGLSRIDVRPFLEALENMRGSYSGHGVRIFKHAVSLPDVSSQYLLSGTMQGLNALELYAPGIKAYEMMLKWAVVGGPSLDFIRKHGAGKTTIRSHKYKTLARASRYSVTTPMRCTQAPCCRKCPSDLKKWCITRIPPKRLIGR